MNKTPSRENSRWGRIIAALCSLFVFMMQIQATECSYRYIAEPHINFGLCQNYSCYNEGITIEYRARTKALSKYIESKIEQGELEDKTFEVAIYDPILSQPQLYLSQSKSSYYIQTSGYVSLEELLLMVDMFCKPNFKLLEIERGVEANEESWNRVDREIKAFYSQERSASAIDFIDTYTNTEKEIGNLKIKYADDKLYYELEGEILKQNVGCMYPVKIKNRYVICERLSWDEIRFSVFEDSNLIKSIKFEDKSMGYFLTGMTAYMFTDWVNFDLYADEPLYSYSYAKNRFYDLTNKEK